MKKYKLEKCQASIILNDDYISLDGVMLIKRDLFMQQYIIDDIEIQKKLILNEPFCLNYIESSKSFVFQADVPKLQQLIRNMDENNAQKLLRTEYYHYNRAYKRREEVLITGNENRIFVHLDTKYLDMFSPAMTFRQLTNNFFQGVQIYDNKNEVVGIIMPIKVQPDLQDILRQYRDFYIVEKSHIKE